MSNIRKPKSLGLRLTYEEAGQYLGVSKEKIKRMVASGELPVVRLSARCIRIRIEDLRAFEEARLVGGVTIKAS